MGQASPVFQPMRGMAAARSRNQADCGMKSRQVPLMQ